MTNANATANNKTSTLNSYLYNGLIVVVFACSSTSIRNVNAKTIPISDAKNNDGWSTNGGLRKASLVTNVIKAAIFQEDNGFEGNIRYVSDEINEIDEIKVKPAASIVDTTISTYSSSSSSSSSLVEEKDCYVSFQSEDLHADDHCEYERKIITALEAEQDSPTHSILIANNECHYDSHTGYWYQAECVMMDEWDVESITFQLVKSFCDVGCTSCYDNDDFPDILGAPSGPVFHSRDEKVIAVCPIPTTEEAGEELVVEFSGNCLVATCQ